MAEVERIEERGVLILYPSTRVMVLRITVNEQAKLSSRLCFRKARLRRPFKRRPIPICSVPAKAFSTTKRGCDTKS